MTETLGSLYRIPFQEFGERSLFHCHILFHEDHGMMAIVDVRA